MTDNELLLQISLLLDAKLKPLNECTKNIEKTLENEIVPRLQNIEASCTNTYKHEQSTSAQLNTM